MNSDGAARTSPAAISKSTVSPSSGAMCTAGHSEFDIICTDGKYIVFAEIKTRNEAPDFPDRYGRPANAVTAKKADALIRGAQRYLREENITGLQPRIDVIEIYAECFPEFRVLKLHHIRNAVVRSEKTENANRR